MIKYFSSSVGRLRLFGFLEGISLIILVFIAAPLKHYYHNPSLTKSMGPIHGALFILYILNALSVSVEKQWSFKKITWQFLIACLIPFGTFYLDYKILRHIKTNEK
ncbi:DUF3817 domain-containing protein [uncultured Maribacter sp.]|uniref:DUF3817 domain-containing protein n=1 Tax=uncultured Maribacter sp. TaxID=431308 RepID=UPI002620A3F7|nr:DUF3817 domain-containing protein [uncultured Maribacter sp.]